MIGRQSVLVLSLLASSAVAQVEVGQELTYTFRSPLLNGKGVKSLEDLRGRPVLFEFWGTA